MSKKAAKQQIAKIDNEITRLVGELNKGKLNEKFITNQIRIRTKQRGALEREWDL